MAPKRTLDGAATQRQEKRPRGGNYSMGSESCDEETTYDCKTQIWLGRGGVARADIIVRSSGIRWIAVQGNDCICVMSSDKNQIIGHDKDKGTLTDFLANLFKDIYDPYAHEYRSDALRSQDSGTRKSFAVVSVVLGTERTNNTFDLKTSNARLNAVKAINSLTEKLSRRLVFTFDESIQVVLISKVPLKLFPIASFIEAIHSIEDCLLVPF